MNYDKLFKYNPTELDSVVNQKGQKITFYENPFNPDYPVIAVYKDKAHETDFFDTGDFFEDSDYNPIYIEESDEFVCAFNLDL